MTQAILVTSKANKFYYGGLYSSRGYVLVEDEKKTIFCDYRSYSECLAKDQGKSIIKLDKDQNPLTIIHDYLKNAEIKNVLFEADAVSYQDYLSFKKEFKDIQLVPSKTSHARMIKSNQEVEKIRKACEIADQTYHNLLEYVQVGMTERELAMFISNTMSQLGSERNAFETIVVSGRRGALPHGKASTKKLVLGDFVTVDFGAVYEGYCSDMTRTFVLGKILDKQMQEIYNSVHRAQEGVLHCLKANLICSDVDAYSRKLIDEDGFASYYVHNLGHGVGIECHEAPYFSSSDETCLQSKMVMTVEPGIYIEGLGGVRIEDTVLITENGCEPLTTSTKELVIVEVNHK